MRPRELALSFVGCSIGWPSWGSAGKPALVVYEEELVGWPTQLPPRSRALSYSPQVYYIYELLDYVKRPILKIQSCRISTTQGNKRLSKRSPDKNSALIVYQKPEALNQTEDSLQCSFASKDVLTKGYTVWHITASVIRWLLLFILSYFISFEEGILQGQTMNRTEVHNVTILKNQ